MPGLTELIDPASVRRAIDPTMPERELENSAILDGVHTSTVFYEVLAAVPDAAGRSGDELEYVKAAVNLLLAAAILPSVPIYSKEDFGDGGSVTRQSVDVNARVAELRRRAFQSLSLLAVETPASSAGTVPAFIVVH